MDVGVRHPYNVCMCHAYELVWVCMCGCVVREVCCVHAVTDGSPAAGLFLWAFFFAVPACRGDVGEVPKRHAFVPQHSKIITPGFALRWLSGKDEPPCMRQQIGATLSLCRRRCVQF